MAVNRNFRTDPATGLVYHEPAEMLMKANAVAGVVCLLLGGILALLVTLTRWPAVHLLPADWFYLVLTAPPVPYRHAAHGVGGLRADGGGRDHEQRGRLPRQLQRDVHLVRADGRALVVLPGAHHLRGG